MSTPDAYPADRPSRPADPLSARQMQCLRLAARGLTSAEIGARLGLSSRTIDEHLLGACRALGVRTRIQAVAQLACSERGSREPRTFLP
ncbi:helix-turn-helix domain-containing protein [Brevundimonas sp. FT23042]|uniref:helix-turn-helix domain-containing protein n=1 Tax=Brevundimonas sp. FT23042 TaxID=3393749 RepID=UPI003B588434